MEPDSYLTIKATSQGIYKDKGSRFIAFAHPISNPDEAKSFLEKLRKEHHSAKHHCYAWMLGLRRQTFKVNDDGEPAGTAGRQILGQINSFRVTNLIIVVVRYFGGKLLGKSGLISAYRSAAESALANSEIIEEYLYEYYRLVFPYSVLNDIMKILKDNQLFRVDYEAGEDCRITIGFRASEREKILNEFSRVEGLKFKYIGT